MSRTKRFVWFAVLGSLVLAGMALLGHRSSSGKALRAYQAELRARGEKLTYAELISHRIDFTNDSLAIITNAIGRLAGSQFNPGVLDIMKFTEPGHARVGWKEDQPFSNAIRSLSWDEIGEILAAAQMNLEEIRLALREPAPDMGVITNIFSWQRPFVAIRSTAQWLSAAAIYEMRADRRENALRNLGALAALARMNRDDPTLVSQMIRVAVAGLGLAVTWEFLQEPGWTESQLQRLQNAWQAVDLVAGVETGFTGERGLGEGVFLRIRSGQNAQALLSSRPAPSTRRGRLEEYAKLTVYRLTSIDDDELLYLQSMQEAIDLIRQTRTNSWAEISSNRKTNFARLNQVAGSLQSFRYVFSMIAIPNYQKAFLTTVQKETQRQLTITAIALKRYELRNRHPAPDLQALVPEFLSALPHDYFSTNHLRYRITERGSPLLYSVGADGHDDGGDPSPAQKGQSPDLWSGRDAVWPQPSLQTNR